MASGVGAASTLLTVLGDRPVQAWYLIECDSAWRVLRVAVEVSGKPERNLRLQAEDAGGWRTATGEPIPELEGCYDVDIYPSPFTNTLPIRRLQLAPGDSAEITVAWIKLPELTIQPAKQRYTCLATGTGGGRYRYEGLQSDFQIELPVDADGLVLDYPGWFRRVWP